jgi:hypothetical protein
MAYITPFDYLKIIQDANLQQIISSSTSIQQSAELAAQSEAISYLRQKYDVSTEFASTTQWDRMQPYSAGNRVYLNALTYATTNTYNINDLTLLSGKIYQCTINGTTGTFNAANWLSIGNQYDIYYALNPFTPFNLGGMYNVGDKVYFNGNVYTCLVQTSVLSHDVAIQYYQTNQIPYANIFPDDPQQGASYWHFEYNYLIPSQTDILDATVWSSSDNRDQQMVMYFADITLYHLHARIAPRNIPELRITRYEAAIDWLKMCAKGDVTPNLPVLQPKSGGRIRYGSQIRNINSY